MEKPGIFFPSSEKTNDNGTRLECFINQNKMCLCSTFFEKHPNDRLTWSSNDKKTIKVLDHVIASQGVQKQMNDCAVNNDLDFLSDHRCVTANISTSSSKKKKYKLQKRKQQKRILNLT